MIDCVALKGYNAILVGPSEKMGMIASLAAAQNLYKTSATLSDDAKEGTVILLNADANGFAAGTIVVKKGGKWVEFEGEILG
jgi:hypothetical protein